MSDHIFDDDETAARLAASLAPIEPPAHVRDDLLAAIEEVEQEQWPQASEEAPARDRRVIPLFARVLAAAAAAVALFAAGIGVGRWTTMTSMESTSHYAALNQAQDVRRSTDTMPDGHIATLTWSQGMSMTALSLPDELLEAAADSSLQVWLRKGEDVSSLGLYDPASGAGFAFLDLMPEEGEQVFITQEPAGGSERPTGEALVTFDVNVDGTTTRGSSTPSDPAPTPSGRPGSSGSATSPAAPSGHQPAKPTGKATA